MLYLIDFDFPIRNLEKDNFDYFFDHFEKTEKNTINISDDY